MSVNIKTPALEPEFCLLINRSQCEFFPLPDFCAEGAEGSHRIHMDKFVHFPGGGFSSFIRPFSSMRVKEVFFTAGIDHGTDGVDIFSQFRF